MFKAIDIPTAAKMFSALKFPNKFDSIESDSPRAFIVPVIPLVEKFIVLK